jgi:hypothetical protein
MLNKGGTALPGDSVLPEEEIKDPFVFEFLGLRDEYSETGLEEALVRHLETFLLELGGDFCFIRYALEGIPNKILAAEYRMTLPDEKELEAEIARTQALLEDREKIPFAPDKKPR